MDIGTDVPRCGWNIDNITGMNPQGPIVTTIPVSNRSNNCDILYSVRNMEYISYRGSPWHGAAKIEGENLGGKNNSQNAEHENMFEVDRVGRKKSVIWNHDPC